MFTVDDLVEQVRDQLQETNTKTVSDNVILSALNRGNSYAWDIYVRHYPDPLMVRKENINLDPDGTFEIPEDAFEQRLQKVELVQGGVSYELERINYRRTTPYRNNIVGTRPAYYSIRSRIVDVLPKPGQSGFTYSIYYVRRPDTLRLCQGQLRSFTSATDTEDATVVVDSVGSLLNVSSAYGKFVNFVDNKTGEVIGSAEIKSIDGQQITFRKTPTRSTVLGRTISGDIPDNLEVDHYISDIKGSCVVYLQQPTTNFLIQYAVTEIRRSLGYDLGAEVNALREFEAQVEHTWAGREASARVKHSNKFWRQWRR